MSYNTSHRLPSFVCIAFLLAASAVSAAPQPEQDKAARLAQLRRDAENGLASAQYQMGRLALEDRNDAETQETARNWFRKAARKCHVRAQYELGYLYGDRMWSLGEKDYRKAVLWLTKAAEQGDADAWLQLGHCLGEGGHGIAQDLTRARECYQKADEKGNAAIWEALGRVYQWGGHGIAADWPKAFAYFNRAAALKNKEAQYDLGRLYQYSIGTEIDLPKAVTLYTKAAEQGDSYAQEQLAWCFEKGIGTAKDLDKATEWYTKATRQRSYVQRHLNRLKALTQVGPPYDRAGSSYPATDEIEISAEPAKAECEIDEPLVVSIRYRNVGTRTYSFEEHHVGGFRERFVVEDAKGNRLPNPFKEPPPRIFDGSIWRNVLKPGNEVVLKVVLNQCVRFERPGTYFITPDWGVIQLGADDRFDEKSYRRGKLIPGRLTVRECDPKRRARDLDRLERALHAGKGLPEGFDSGDEHFSSWQDTLRFLAFYGEPALMPLFLGVLENGDDEFANAGLRALPDRAAVLKAFEERLGHPEKYHSVNLLWSYIRLVAPDTFEDAPGDLSCWKKQEEILRKYQTQALELLKRDKKYQYAHHVPGLLGGADDLILIDYLIRCKLPVDQVPISCFGPLGRVNLGLEHAPFLESLLPRAKDWYRGDAVILQLMRLDRAKYLPELKKNREHFSPGVYTLLLEDGESD